MHVGKDGQPTNVPEWTHISHNLILNGPTIGHTSSLFPFVDNDDGTIVCMSIFAWRIVVVDQMVSSDILYMPGSAYFSIVKNVGIYGGGKVLLLAIC